jgi:hypothetical protein
MMLSLSKRERGQLVRLLVLLQEYLESAIESAIVPGTYKGMPDEPDNIEVDRKDLKLAKRWAQRIGSLK